MKHKEEELINILSLLRGPSDNDSSINQTATDLREQQFHNFIREILVCLFIYGFLYLIAFVTIKVLRKAKETDEYVIDYEDAVADRVRIWICTFALATCFGAVLLLPMSIIASEVIKITPQSIYWKWLNSSLLHGLWNLIFLFSNLSLFIFLPFAHLFVESIGLPGSKKGIKSRFIETLIIIFFIVVILVGFSYVISAILDTDNAKLHSLLSNFEKLI
ncbi:LMBR1L [Brachionus plicatilis]|uniref:LMBR1L n=1 Tax=Brachionus plicatilis TaxID=10195 RepID=A0A3M7P6W1_BRAPC|nr:LMBR1L [Brachionus plicatilis]